MNKLAIIGLAAIIGLFAAYALDLIPGFESPWDIIGSTTVNIIDSCTGADMGTIYVYRHFEDGVINYYKTQPVASPTAISVSTIHKQFEICDQPRYFTMDGVPLNRIDPRGDPPPQIFDINGRVLDAEYYTDTSVSCAVLSKEYLAANVGGAVSRTLTPTDGCSAPEPPPGPEPPPEPEEPETAFPWLPAVMAVLLVIMVGVAWKELK
jgi:hypothetical protein